MPTSTGSSKKQEKSKKTSISALLTTPKPFNCVDHRKLWKILKEMGIPDHLTCHLRNLYAGQEATFRTGHGTMDWFQTGKGVPFPRKGKPLFEPCIYLSTCNQYLCISLGPTLGCCIHGLCYICSSVVRGGGKDGNKGSLGWEDGTRAVGITVGGLCH